MSWSKWLGSPKMAQDLFNIEFFTRIEMENRMVQREETTSENIQISQQWPQDIYMFQTTFSFEQIYSW